MPSQRTTRAATQARSQILDELKEDHKRVKKAYRQFQKLDPQEDRDEVEALVQQVLDELSVHATLEEELLYPAARQALSDEDLIDEAEVEHESMHTLIDQLRGMSCDDEKYCARFTVLCEYVTHHVKEEESEMFPKLEHARMDWESLASEMTERRAELTGEPADAEDGSEQTPPPTARSAGSAGSSRARA
ncbi:hemerythrin domain-containing protein [Pelomonas cellulosilytica]|uniref:Hemerythrin domain-containing protein n=1 Tax=Pelomonas cellulosilytica TaxID=2906762 RepID=A0ABS8XMS0_9BURK|nr:hemerythrin domain-containing protein [Pelomonas sp. P8]MCE4553118.1 hemerythrin domain-containing protein [Pelomonas sp. P8]